MEKYLLKEEKKRITKITNTLSKSLNTSSNNLEQIKNKFQTIIKTTKDSNTEEILNTILTSLIKEMTPLITQKITPALQFSIQNQYYTLTSYGGTYNGTYNSKEITPKTLFSLDSISKLLTSTTVYIDSKNYKNSLQTKINELNKDFALTSSIESILKFTARIKTEKRIENLSKEETIEILKKVKENQEEKNKYKNYYEYNDIGYIILRLSINNFLEKLDKLLEQIDKTNITYNNTQNKTNITGGKLTEEYFTPDEKARTIPFPGHTGLYANIEGLINIFQKLIAENNILTQKDKEILFSPPYKSPIKYDSNLTPLKGKINNYQYMAKVAGIYRKPEGITEPYFDKISSCDMSNLTTPSSKAATGTCGSWVISDNLHYQNHFTHYTGAILTNPYSFIEKRKYKQKEKIPNTSLTVNQKGVIIGYQAQINKYKEIITEYSLILELITEYLIQSEKKEPTPKKLIKKLY